MKGEIIGFIYPLKKEFIDRFIFKNKTVFVKFVRSIPNKKSKFKLKPGHKIYFYQTRSDRVIVGEAKISEIFFLNAADTIKKFGDKIFLSRSELTQYERGRRNKKMMVVLLKNAKGYSNPVKMKKPLTMAGMYMKKKLQKELLK